MPQLHFMNENSEFALGWNNRMRDQPRACQFAPNSGPWLGYMAGYERADNFLNGKPFDAPLTYGGSQITLVPN